MLNKTVKDFLAEISSENPTPAGGSVSAFSGVLSACLLEMCCKLTIGREKYKSVEKIFKNYLKEIEILKEKLEKLYGDDVDAYNEVIKAYKIPKNDKDRDEKIQTALKKATLVPLETAEKCSLLLKIGKEVAMKGNQNCLSDAGVGLMLLLVGIKGSAMNVKMNLKFINDKKFSEKTNKKLSEIEKNMEIMNDFK